MGVLLYRVEDADEAPDEHEGYVAGRCVDGYLTAVSVDGPAQLDDRYVAYVPRCQCGWTGPAFSTTAAGFAACRRLWREKHLGPFLRARGPRRRGSTASWTPTVIDGGFPSTH